MYNIKMTSLPLVTLTWTSEQSIVAAGHDCQPYVFSGSEGGWEPIGTLDDTSAPKSASARPGVPGKLNKSAAFATFQSADSRGQSSIAASSDTKLLTIHQNTITSVRPYEEQGGVVTKVTTSGADGRLIIWDTNEVSALATKLATLSV